MVILIYHLMILLLNIFLSLHIHQSLENNYDHHLLIFCINCYDLDDNHQQLKYLIFYILIKYLYLIKDLFVHFLNHYLNQYYSFYFFHFFHFYLFYHFVKNFSYPENHQIFQMLKDIQECQYYYLMIIFDRDFFDCYLHCQIDLIKNFDKNYYYEYNYRKNGDFISQLLKLFLN